MRRIIIPLFLCLILFSAICCHCLIDNQADTSIKNDHYFLKRILGGINVQDEHSLYQSQNFLMLPLIYAFKLNQEYEKKLIIHSLLQALNSTQKLGDLRRLHQNGTLSLTNNMLNPQKSGSDRRMVFPLKSDAGQYNESSSILSTLQFSYVLSSALKYLLQYGEKDFSIPETEFIPRCFYWLLDNVVRPFWLDIQAGHWMKSFPNIKHRTLYRLHWKDHPEILEKSYYKVFFDEDFFLFAIAADLLYVVANHQTELDQIGLKTDELSKNILLLTEIRKMTFQMISSQTEWTENFFFQKGMWKDHPDYFYAGWEDEQFPEQIHPKKDISPDASHFQRFPWWWRSYRDSWPEASDEFYMYSEIISSFGRHFLKHIGQITKKGPLITNYIDGSNGWYRVGYHPQYEKFGYGPYKLSHVLVTGSYFSLAQVNKQFKKFNKCFYKAIQHEGPFRNKYYDEEYPTTFTQYLKQAGLYDQRFQLYAYFGRLIKHLDWM